MRIQIHILTLAAAIATAICLSSFCLAQDHIVSPDETFKFASRDTCDLFMDVYYPADGSEDTINGRRKPTILYMFGGGFKMGSRDDIEARKWFTLLTDAGFTVASIDYRLGLKDATKAGVGQAMQIHHAISIAVEDLFSATAFIIDNAAEVDIEPDNIILSGSSAGAISVMQAEWERANRFELAEVLPEDFKYAGVISFAGAVFSKRGAVRYKSEPAPTLIFHGTDDKIVNYKQLRAFNLAFEGGGRLSREFRRKAYNYSIYRYDGNGHEIAAAMVTTFPEQLRFIEDNIMAQKRRIIDAKVKDPSIEAFSLKTRKQIYGGDF